MTFEINKHKCEICNEQAKVAINDSTNKFHFSCLIHIDELWEKIGKP